MAWIPVKALGRWTAGGIRMNPPSLFSGSKDTFDLLDDAIASDDPTVDDEDDEEDNQGEDEEEAEDSG